MLRSIVTYGFIALYVLIMAPWSMAWTAVRRNTTLIYKVGRLCVATAGWIAGVNVRVQGREKLVPGQHYVFLSNHQGNCDGPALFHAIPRDIRILIKKEIMQLPLLSRVLKQVQFVAIDRSDPAQSHAGIDRASGLIASGYSFLAFPEGTRSKDGGLGTFKKGAFIMAVKAAAPIVPVTIANSAQRQAPGSFLIRPGQIDIVFHDPVETEGIDTADLGSLVEHTREVIGRALPHGRLMDASRASSP